MPLIVALVLLVACKDKHAEGACPKGYECEWLDIHAQGSAVLTPDEGGRLEAGDGELVLEVPPGAVAEETTVAAVGLGEAGSGLWLLLPAGTTFAVPASLTIRTSGGPEEPEEGFAWRNTLWAADEETGEAELVSPVRFGEDGDRLLVSADIEHFSVWRTVKVQLPVPTIYADPTSRTEGVGVDFTQTFVVEPHSATDVEDRLYSVEINDKYRFLNSFEYQLERVGWVRFDEAIADTADSGASATGDVELTDQVAVYTYTLSNVAGGSRPQLDEIRIADGARCVAAGAGTIGYGGFATFEGSIVGSLQLHLFDMESEAFRKYLEALYQSPESAANRDVRIALQRAESGGPPFTVRTSQRSQLWVETGPDQDADVTCEQVVTIPDTLRGFDPEPADDFYGRAKAPAADYRLENEGCWGMSPGGGGGGDTGTDSGGDTGAERTESGDLPPPPDYWIYDVAVNSAAQMAGVLEAFGIIAAGTPEEDGVFLPNACDATAIAAVRDYTFVDLLAGHQMPDLDDLEGRISIGLAIDSDGDPSTGAPERYRADALRGADLFVYLTATEGDSQWTLKVLRFDEDLGYWFFSSDTCAFVTWIGNELTFGVPSADLSEQGASFRWVVIDEADPGEPAEMNGEERLWSFPRGSCVPPKWIEFNIPDIAVGATGSTGEGEELCETYTWVMDVSGEDNDAALFDIGDVNCDGLADVAYARPGADMVEISYGDSSEGLSPGPTLYEPGNNQYPHEAQFGDTVAAGDLNGDGCSDVAVAAPDTEIADFGTVGAISVYFGGPGGLAEEPDQVLWLTESDIAYSRYFGTGLAIGDVNGDGMDDVVGVPQGYVTPYEPADWPWYITEYTVGNALFVFSGSAAGVSTTPEPVVFVGVEGSPDVCVGSYGYFGWVVIPGDVDGDGLEDVVAYCWGRSSSTQNALLLFPGASIGHQMTFFTVLADSTDLGSSFTTLLASPDRADYNGDGLADISLIAQQRDIADLGWVIYGATSLARGPNWTVSGDTVGELNYPTGLGPAGDINRDGFTDLFTTYAETSRGENNLLATYLGGAGGLELSSSQVFERELDEGLEPFMAVVGPGDVDGDGCDDLIEYDSSELLLALHRSCACD